VTLVIIAPSGARYSNERTGCLDPAQNRAPSDVEDSFGRDGSLGFSYVMRGDWLELSAWGAAGAPNIDPPDATKTDPLWGHAKARQDMVEEQRDRAPDEGAMIDAEGCDCGSCGQRKSPMVFSATSLKTNETIDDF